MNMAGRANDENCQIWWIHSSASERPGRKRGLTLVSLAVSTVSLLIRSTTAAVPFCKTP